MADFDPNASKDHDVAMQATSREVLDALIRDYGRELAAVRQIDEVRHLEAQVAAREREPTLFEIHADRYLRAFGGDKRRARKELLADRAANPHAENFYNAALKALEQMTE